jgi:hypothetical protein
MDEKTTYYLIKDTLTKLNYKFFDKGLYNLNIVYVRNNDIFTDKYTDTLYVAYRDESGLERVYTAPCTTKAGTYYVNNPLVVMGIKGTAVLPEGQYSQTWKFIDNNSWLGYPYLKQNKDITIWRDGVIDNDIDITAKQTGNFGINCHRGGDLRNLVYNWSAACLVTPLKEWLPVIELLRKATSLYGDIFTITLIKKESWVTI